MRILMIMHSHTRWLVLIAAVLVIIKFAWSWLRGDSFQKIDRILAAAFGGLLDLQATLGLIVLLWNGLIDGAGSEASTDTDCKADSEVAAKLCALLWRHICATAEASCCDEGEDQFHLLLLGAEVFSA